MERRCLFFYYYTFGCKSCDWVAIAGIIQLAYQFQPREFYVPAEIWADAAGDDSINGKKLTGTQSRCEKCKCESGSAAWWHQLINHLKKSLSVLSAEKHANRSKWVSWVTNLFIGRTKKFTSGNYKEILRVWPQIFFCFAPVISLELIRPIKPTFS